MDKFNSLFTSRRFWVALSTIAFLLSNQFGLTLDEQTIQMIVLAAGSWVVGDSIRKTQ